MTAPSFDYLTTPLTNRQLLVEASAGTGKTFALTGLVVRLVLEGVELKQILFVTFTNAATAELKTRIRSRLREVLDAFHKPHGVHSSDAMEFVEQFGQDPASLKKLEEALLGVDEASIFTIHGFCQRVLQQSAFESGSPFEAKFVENADELFDRAVADFFSRNTHEDEWLAALGADAKPDDLRKHYREATRYPDTRVEPDAIDLSEAVARLRDEVDRLCGVWHERKDDAYELLKATTWTQQGRFQDASLLESTFEQLSAKLEETPFECRSSIELISLSTILNGAKNRSKAEKAYRELLSAEPLFTAADQFINAVEDAGHSLIRSFIFDVGQRFTELKQTAGVLTFDDLLERVDEALAPDSDTRERLLTSIRGRWSHALIDEFQDTDPRQYRIFRTAFEGRPLVFVGDSKQAIYSFRGADLHAYIRAKDDTEGQASGPHRYMLDRNWRSATKLVEAVNKLFEQPREHPFLMEGVPYEPVEAAGSADQKPLDGDDRPPLVWWEISDESMSKGQATPLVVDGVVNGIKQILYDGLTINGAPVAPGHIAVLVRDNRESEAIQDALREARIPAVVSKGGNVWDSDEAAEVEYLLRAFLRPSDTSSICTALATSFWGHDAASIHTIRNSEVELDAMRTKLDEYQRIWRHSGVLRALAQFIEDEEVTARLLALIDGQRRLTNLRHVMELLHEEESRNNRGMDELAQWLRTRETRKSEDADTTELRLETDADAVQITTIHKSKGLQYDIVIAPFLWSAKQKHGKGDSVLVHENDGTIVYDVGSDDAERRRRIADAERLAEDLRLAYVALTRAVHRCYVVIGDVNQSEMSALGYLLRGHEAAGGGSIDDRAQNAFAAARDYEAIIGKLGELSHENDSLMTIEPLPTNVTYTPAPPLADESFAPRELPEQIITKLTPWRVTSYTQLSMTDAEDAFFPAMTAEREGFFAFASGRNAGSCLHEIIEEVDVAALPLIGKEPVPQVENLVARKLRAFGLTEPEKHSGGPAFDPHQEVMQFLRRLGQTPILIAGVTMPELDPKRTLWEWSFLVPIDAITPEGLANAVAGYADEPIRNEYPKRLRRLSQSALNGYLTGIADFAFEHEGRWYVFDWKSTHLGTDLQDYAADKLVEAALDRHYVLQLLVYALGLHRYLKTRLSGYDYDRHVGGSGVVFLRGVDGESDNGFYVLRPPRELIEALDAMLRPVPARQISFSG